MVRRAYSSAVSQTALDLRWFRVALSIGAGRRDKFAIPCTSRPVFTVNMVTGYIDLLEGLVWKTRDEKSVTGKIAPVVNLLSNSSRFSHTLRIVDGSLERVRSNSTPALIGGGHTSYAL